jgi:hypothetical protein
MNNPFLIKKQVDTKVSTKEITVKHKKVLVDLYMSTNKNVTVTKHKMGELRLPASQIKSLFGKIDAVFSCVQQVMNGTAVKKVIPATEERASETIYYDIPSTKLKLNKRAYTFFPDCDKDAFEYVIKMIIKWSNGEGTATWNDFVSYFK